ncbi:MAG: ribonuclease P protein component [Synechococcus sp.]
MVLPQRHRLRGRGVFDYLYQRGQRFQQGLLQLRVAEAAPKLLRDPPLEPEGELRFGVVISSKVSKRAVKRNRLRRRLHEAFLRQAFRSDLPPTWLLLNLRPGAAELSDDNLLKEWSTLIQRAGLTDS